MKNRIRTHFVYPPIPDRRFDWQAVYDDDEPTDEGRMDCGYGRTEAAAVIDLIENFPRGVQCEREIVVERDMGVGDDWA